MAGEGGFLDMLNRVAQNYPDLGRVRDELRDIGLALVFAGASILVRALTTNNDRVFKGVMIFIAGIGLLTMSFQVNNFPLASRVLLAATNNLIRGNLFLD